MVSGREIARHCRLLRTRLARVGATKDIFSTDALAILYEAVASSLRDTGRMCPCGERA